LNFAEIKTTQFLGAMYAMIKIDLENFPKFSSCLEFMQHLAMEQSVFVFPGIYFNSPGFFRIVTTTPEDLLIEACERMKEFCGKYYVG
jgi:tyrosine aminotransferase